MVLCPCGRGHAYGQIFLVMFYFPMCTLQLYLDKEPDSFTRKIVCVLYIRCAVCCFDFSTCVPSILNHLGKILGKNIEQCLHLCISWSHKLVGLA